MKRADIQGLRAIAVGIVVAFHAGVPGFWGGYVGVDVFFVISGYLITRRLVEEFDGTGRVAFGRFWARRVRRIVPAAAVVGVLTLAASVLLLPVVRLGDVAHDAVATALFVPNLLFAARGTDYLSAEIPSPFLHYWSLGVEEQFYLFWPLLVVGAAVLARRRGIPVLLGIVAVGSIAFAEWMLVVAPVWAFYSLPTRAGEFAIGGIVAWVLLRYPPAPRAMRLALGWAGLAAIGGATVLLRPETAFPGVAALVPVLGAAGVIAAGGADDAPGSVGRMLGIRPLVVIGTLSFVIYLVHWPLLELPTETFGAPLPLRWAVPIALASVPLAWVIHRLVERPVLVRPIMSPVRWLAVGAGIAVVFASLGAVASVIPSLVPTSAGRSLSTAAPSDATPFVPSDLQPALTAITQDLPATYSNGCHVPIGTPGVPDCRVGDPGAPFTVALFGDSHAALWYPALADLAADGTFELLSFTKSACHAWDIVTYRNGVADPTCPTWRSEVLTRLRDDPPDLVIIASNNEQATDPAAADRWSTAVTPTLAALTDVTTVVVLADTPYLASDPVACLAKHLHNALVCASRAIDVTNAPIGSIVRADTESAGAIWVPTVDLVCPDGLCAMIRGKTPVFRDDNHLTATYSRSLGPALWARIEAALEKSRPARRSVTRRRVRTPRPRCGPRG